VSCDAAPGRAATWWISSSFASRVFVLDSGAGERSVVRHGPTVRSPTLRSVHPASQMPVVDVVLTSSALDAVRRHIYWGLVRFRARRVSRWNRGMCAVVSRECISRSRLCQTAQTSEADPFNGLSFVVNCYPKRPFGGTIENAQAIACHESPRTTKPSTRSRSCT